MFTGIIQDLASIAGTEALAGGRRLLVSTAIPTSDIAHGESIAINGACMTVTEIGNSVFAVDVSSESLRRTTLGDLVEGDRVNLERSMRLNDRLGGHIVSGHVDGTGTVSSIRREGESAIYRFAVPRELTTLLVEKGSVAVDGISLTCFGCDDEGFDVAVIPHTAAVTTLGLKRSGSRVNIENDVLAKYVAKLAKSQVDAVVQRARTP